MAYCVERLLYTYLYDGQGSVTQHILKGREANSYDCDPFGDVEDGVKVNDIIFSYNGEEYTEAAGLQYLRIRHYDPQTETFTSQDTYSGSLQNPYSQNRYTYAENDPVNGNDPGGDKKKSKKTSKKSTSKKTTASKKKALKKTTEIIKEKAKRLKKTMTCNVAKAGRTVVSVFKPEPVYAGEKDSGKTKNNKELKKDKAPKKTDLYQQMLLTP